MGELTPYPTELPGAAGATFVLGALMLACLITTQAEAFVLDMEGHAPPGAETNEGTIFPPNFGVSIQGSFKLTVEHGHYWSVTNPDIYAQSDIGGTASDWFFHDAVTPLKVEEVSGSSFSITSFQAGESWGSPTPSTTGNPIHVTGYLTGGGTITTTFISDATPSDGVGPNVDFETFVFGTGWDDLIAVEFKVDPPHDITREFGYDNIVVDVLPPPTACLCDGDLDNDGTVTAADTALLLACIGATPTLPSDPCYPSDLDCDGIVEESDVDVMNCQQGAAPNPLCCECIPLLGSTTATPTFSEDAHSATMQSGVPPTFPVGGTYLNSGSQVLVTADGGAPGPNIVSAADSTLTPGVVRDHTQLGLVVIGYLEIDALSYGRDAGLVCGDFGTKLQFSADEYAMGVVGTGVGIFAGSGAKQAAADTFNYAGPIAPTSLGAPIGATLDIDGSRMGLMEPFHPPSMLYGDNLDAIDRDTSPADLANRIYFSMDAVNPDPLKYFIGGAVVEGHSGADVLVSEGGVVSLAIAAATLGLDLAGADTDDLDALAFHDADLSGGYTAGDALLFSVRRGSAVVGTLDSLLGIPIEPGDVLTLPTGPGLTPSIYIPAERLGLLTVRTDSVTYGDELDALDAAFVPEPGVVPMLIVGSSALLALGRRRRRTRGAGSG